MGKKWYLSKLLWLGIAAMATGIAEMVSGLPTNASIATIAIGLTNVIIRVFFTNQALTK